jgi:probable addiction module antidote protein
MERKSRRTKPLATRPYDSASYLTDDESIVAYIEEVIESGDPTLVSHALGVVARAKGMAQVAREAGVSREHLYRALSSEGNPEFGTVLKVLGALGLRLSVEKADKTAA